MKSFCVFCVLFSVLTGSGGEKEGLSDDLKKFVENPQMGARCQKLINKRKNSMDLMQRAVSLEEKTSKMMLKVPEQKKTIRDKLENLKNEFFKEKSLLELKVKILEEEIIMKGCPGVKL